MADSIQTLRARVAALTRHGSDPDCLAAAKHELAVTVAAGYIERICAEPTLTTADLARLTAPLHNEALLRQFIADGLGTRT